MDEEEPTGMVVSVGATIDRGMSEAADTHLSSEEEIERLRGALMRRIRVLPAECEGLEEQFEVAQQRRQTAMESHEQAVQARNVFPRRTELTR